MNQINFCMFNQEIYFLNLFSLQNKSGKQNQNCSNYLGFFFPSYKLTQGGQNREYFERQTAHIVPGTVYTLTSWSKESFRQQGERAGYRVSVGTWTQPQRDLFPHCKLLFLDLWEKKMRDWKFPLFTTCFRELGNSIKIPLPVIGHCIRRPRRVQSHRWFCGNLPRSQSYRKLREDSDWLRVWD